MTWRPTLADHKAYAAAFLLAIHTWRTGHHQAAIAEALTTAGLTRRQKAVAAARALDPDSLRSHLHTHLAARTGQVYDRAWDDGLRQAERRWGSLDEQRLPDSDPHTLQRIDLLATGTLDATTAAAYRALQLRLDPWTAAALTVNTAGLNTLQAPAVVTWAAAQQQADPRHAPARIRRRAERELRRRATIVGWTEPSTAAAEGRLAAWRYYGDRQALAQALTGGHRPVREWVVDGNPCDACNAMAGQTVGIFDEFPGGDPPRHPSCRCTTVLREGPAAAREAAA